MAKTILIVEDNEMNMKLFNDILQSKNYKTVQTDEGHEVMGLATQHRPDLILMDIQLPTISGLEVVKHLKDSPNLKHIPVVAVTALAMKDDRQKMLDGGCDDYLPKPISIARFLDTVSRHLAAA